MKMTSRLPPQCLTCFHWVSPLQRDDDDATKPEPTQICDAFRTGIPAEIWWNRFDHRRPFPGDHGIRWEPVAEGVDFPDWAMDEGEA